ncbi:ATP-dependent helicase [Synechocystis sp. FACHB-383]|uniref:ATP-dependent helicase n=1 Tax=Synechocystis sp. FACHB-383 TaxID=2692864 RepID=UPI00168582D5|nr:ATP-dependent helicase [Synechocystis sp. FACHB-383]MBD2653203.1 ATP-dependent helicase [Synechocystis sp. FACHB-383]
MNNDKKVIDISKSLLLLRPVKFNLKDSFSAMSELFYKLIKTLTDSESIVFRNFYARFRYCLSNLNLDGQDVSNLDAFRRFIRRGFSEKVNQVAIEQGILLLQRVCLKAVKNSELLEFTIDNNQYNNQYFTTLSQARRSPRIKYLKLLYTGHHQSKSRRAFRLYGFSLDNLQTSITLECDWFNAPHLFYLTDLLNEDTLIACHNLVPVAENKYQANSESLIVVEPDFLVDASAISECFGNRNTSSDIFWLNKLVGELAGAPAFKGTIVGYYLDELVRNEQIDIAKIFADYKKSDALRCAYLGEKEMVDIQTSITQEHLPNIASLVKKLHQENLSIWIEPTFFSQHYGLQGRLDLLTINPKGSKDIIELKSGGAPYPGREWKNHKMQVVAYNMMLESTYGNYVGNKEIFYSKSDQPRRSIVSESQEKNELIKVRNEIVSKIYQLAKGDFISLDKLKNNGAGELPEYNQRRLNRFQQGYQPGRLTTNYYQQLISFTLRELINNKTSDSQQSELEDKHQSSTGFASLWLDDFNTKQSNYQLLYDLRVMEVDKRKSYLSLALTQSDIAHSFRAGDMVIIYPKIDGEYEPLKQHIFKGSIKIINQEQIVVSLFNKQTDYSFIEKYDFWALETDIFERNYWSSIACLLEVLACSMEKKQLLLGHLEPQILSINYQENDFLTSNQNQIICQALEAKHYYLLQGPPGTGKTSIFLVNYVQNLLKLDKKNIFILAFTNKAVEQICKALKNPRHGEPIDYLRLGNKTIVDENLVAKKLTGNNADQWRKFLQESRIFVTTVSTFKDKYLLLREFVGEFDQLIVDEASQLTEADVAGIVALFNKFVLIGDQKQLPAVITQGDGDCLVKTKEFLRYNIHFTDLRMSLFERLITNAKNKKWDHCYGQLTEHYRMHRDISLLIAHHYDRQLVEQRGQQRETKPDYGEQGNYLLKELSKSRTVFVETPSEIGLQRKNTNEAIIAAEIVKTYWENNLFSAAEIGIIAPFRAQVAEINQQLERILGNADLPIVVDTVERFQGDERELIIFSTTISWSKQVKNIQSIADHDRQNTDRKLLVSISRAKSKLIILGNSSQLQFAPAYRELIKHIEQTNGLIDLAVGREIITCSGSNP